MIRRRTAFRPIVAAIVVALVALVGGAAAHAAPPAGALAAGPLDPGYVPGHVVVRFAPGATAAERAAARRAVGATLGRRLGLPGAELLVLRDPAGSVLDAVRALERRPAVAYAEPDMVATAQSCPGTLTGGLCRPDDPAFNVQWGMQNVAQVVNGSGGGRVDADIDAPEAWNVTRGSGDVVVAVVDSGIAYDQPDLAAHIWHNAGEAGARSANGVDDDGNGYVDDWQGWDVVGDDVLDPADPDNDPVDISGHGTHVAGIIGALTDNAKGVAGVAWDVQLMNVRVRAERSNETSADIADAFVYAARNGARIVNVSLAEVFFSQYLRDTIAAHPEALFVIAAGNNGYDLGPAANASYPCEYDAPNILCVAATSQADGLAAFSNYDATSVDLGAPGTITQSSSPSYADVGPFESFESDPFTAGRWARGAYGDAVNRWALSTTRAFPGARSAGSGVVSGGDTTWIGSEAPVDLRGQRGCELRFRLWGQFSPGSGLVVQARADRAFQAPAVQPNQDLQAPGIDTISFIGAREGDRALTVDRRPLRINVSDLDGRSAYVRFNVMTAPGATAQAWVDEVQVKCLGGAYTANGVANLVYLQGTSMATPHVAGTAALVAARYPGETAAELKADLMAAVDPLPALAGRTVTGGRLNAYKAVARSTAAVEGATLTIAAGEGEANHLVVRRQTEADGAVRVHLTDAWTPYGQAPMGGSRVVPGARCSSVGVTEARCSAAVDRIVVRAGDLDDDLDTADGVAQEVDCGTGSDTLVRDAEDTASNCEAVTVRAVPEPPAVPDADGDGVPDELDGCPALPAVTSTGCPAPDSGADPAPPPTPSSSVTPSPSPSSSSSSAPSATPSPSATPIPPPGPPSSDTLAPTLVLPAAGQRLAVSRTGTFRLRIGPVSEPATGELTLRSTRRLALRPGAARRPVDFGTARLRLGAGGTALVRLHLSAAKRRLVRRLGRVDVRARVVLRDAAGNRAVRSVVLGLRG